MQTETNLLQEFEQHYEEASVGQRLINHIIDIIALYAIAYAIGIGIGIAIVLSGAAYSTGDEPGKADPSFQLLLLLGGYVFYVLFMAVSEKLGKGKSLGKLVTRTIVIRDDGAAFTWKDAFLRSLSRTVPFEPFSAFSGYPWHDKWTNTRVVKIKR